MCHAFELSLVGSAFRQVSIRENRAMHHLTYFGDLSGLRFRQAMALLPFLEFVTKGVERFFPETAGKVTLFNAPAVFAPCISIAKLFLDKNTVANLSVFTALPKGQFVEEVGPEVFPREYGGKLEYELPHIPVLPA